MLRFYTESGSMTLIVSNLAVDGEVLVLSASSTSSTGKFPKSIRRIPQTVASDKLASTPFFVGILEV